MYRKMSLGFLSIAILLMIAVTLVPLRQAQAAPAGSRYGANYFPNTELTDQSGKVVHFYDDLIKDKIVVIDFIYTHCKDMCPLETARLAQVQKILGDRVGKDIFFYSISIDPTKDTPAVMKAYSDKFHAGPGWLFLTGKNEDIVALEKKLGMYTEPDPNDRDGHAPKVLLGNEATGQWMQNAATDNPRFLATMIENYLVGWTNRRPTTQASYADVREIKMTHKGQYLFATRCAACHTIGHGDSVGPDLLGVPKVRSKEWLSRFIGTPDKVLDEKDPIATALLQKYKVQMPNLRVSSEDVGYIISFLEVQTAEAEAKTQASSAAAPQAKP